MSLEEREIDTGSLMEGMYVCRLDRPWADTPFLMQGFFLESEQDLALVRRYCDRVWIDVERGVAPFDAPLGTLEHADAGPPPHPELLRNSVHHADTSTLDDELPRARQAQGNAVAFMGKILDDVCAGRKLTAQDLHGAVEPIVQSVLRSADAMFWMDCLRKRDAYAYSHAINCSALAAAFGRHMGFPRETLMELAQGGLLMDLGKAQLDVDLLAVPGPLAGEQRRRMRTHVDLSLRIFEESGLDSAVVHDMICAHHERHDGSGYPNAASDQQIPLFGRIAGLVDSFDAMTSRRPYATAMARHDALQELYRGRDVLFQSELVEQFIGCLGVYPTGSLVELNTGEVAVVVAQNHSRRLRPRVLLLTTPDKRLSADFKSLDLMHQVERAELDTQINIARPLQLGAYGLDPSELYL